MKNRFIGQPSAREIIIPNLSPRGFQQGKIISRRLFIDLKQSLSDTLLLFLLCCHFLLGKIDPGLLGQHLHRLRKSEIFILHHKGQYIAAHTTAKAFIHLPGGIYMK